MFTTIWFLFNLLDGVRININNFAIVCSIFFHGELNNFDRYAVKCGAQILKNCEISCLKKYTKKWDYLILQLYLRI